MSTSTVTTGAVFPLRVLSQDEIFSAAMAVIRHAPRATLGVPLLAGILNFVFTIVMLTVAPGFSLMRIYTDPASFEDQEVALATFADMWVLLLMSVTSFVGSLLLLVATTLVVIPALRASYGLPTSLTQTLQISRKRLGWLLLHLLLVSMALGTVVSILVVVAALVLVFTTLFAAVIVIPALLLAMLWVTVALMYAPLVIVTENRDPIRAIGRSFQLNKGLWWRNMGTICVVVVMVLIIGSVVVLLPGALFGGLAGTAAWETSTDNTGVWILVLLVLAQLFEAVVTAGLLALTGAVISVLYLNSRFRQEALDVVLLDAASNYDENTHRLPGSPQHTGEYFAGALDAR